MACLGTGLTGRAISVTLATWSIDRGRYVDPNPYAARQRWVFGDYVVYARDRFLAREIFEAVTERPEPDQPFGIVSLPNGTGNWLRLARRRRAAPPS
jgi:hypothetical protein